MSSEFLKVFEGIIKAALADVAASSNPGECRPEGLSA
jgi:hypothetical protein